MKTPEYKELIDQVGDNWYTILPPESVVGYIMTDPKKYKIVQSDAYSSFDEPFKVFFQHDTFTWMFKDGHIDCGGINSGKTGPFSQFINDVLDDSMALIPKGILQKVSDTSFEFTGGILDDKIMNYFYDVKKAYDNSLFEGYLRLGEGGVNLLETEISFMYTIKVVKETIKVNLEKAAIKYGYEKLKEGIEYGKKLIKAFGNWCEEQKEKFKEWSKDKIEDAKDIWSYVGLKLSEILKDYESKKNKYVEISMSICNVAICNGNGQIGLEFNFIPEISKIIDNVVNNLNKSVSDCLTKIESKINKLEYTSFSLDTNYCRQSLKNQKNSLYDFKNELFFYEARINNMENDIIKKLKTVECDCLV